MRQLELERPLANQTLQRRNPRLVGLAQIGGLRVVIERAGLVHVDPSNVYVRPDQVAGDVGALRQTVQGLARQSNAM